MHRQGMACDLGMMIVSASTEQQATVAMQRARSGFFGATNVPPWFAVVPIARTEIRADSSL